MAQLVHCPECNSDFLLPQSPGERAQCPECEATFAVSEVAVRTVHEGRVLSEEDTEAPELPKLTPAAERPSLPSFGGTTLASFLREAEERAGATDNPAAAPADKHGQEDSPIKLEPLSFGQTLGNPADLGDTSEQDEAEPRAPEPADTSTANPFAATSAADLFSFDRPRDEASATQEEAAGETSEPAPNEFSSRLADLSLPEQPGTFDAASDEQNDFAPADPQGDDEYELQDEAAQQPHPWETSDTNLDYSTPLETDEPEFASLNTDHHDDDPSPVGQFRAGGSTGQAPRRRSSNGWSARKTLGIVAAGPIGLGLGYVIVLWALHWQGRTDDPIGLAAYLPNAILPATFQSPSSDTSRVVQSPEEEGEADPAEPARRGVEQANFEEPVEKGATGDEPDRFTLPEMAQPALPFEPELTGVPQYSLDDLAVAYNDAQGSAAGLLEGDFAQASVRPVKGSSFAKLARLAHVVGFLPEDQRDAPQVDQALQLYPPLFRQPRHRAEISLIASYWLVSEKRSHSGVFFCGLPDQGVDRGSVVEYQFMLPDNATNLTVLTPQRLDPAEFADAERVGVVGNLLQQPTNHIEGYTGTADKAIWAGHLFPIRGE